MSKAIFKDYTPSQPQLFGFDIDAALGENHPAKLVHAIVEQLDISEIMATYKGGGASSYHPKMLLKILFYSYLNNITSSRKIERGIRENIGLIWLAGGSTPDFRTINGFRGNKLKDKILGIFADIVRMMSEMGLVSLERQYIDGTKMEANANKYSFVWRKSVEKNKAKLESKIQLVLENIEESIATDSQENTTPEQITIDSNVLKEKIKTMNEKRRELNKAQKKQLKSLEDNQLPKLEEYEQLLEILGERNSYSKTDPDATFMRLKDDHMQNGQLKAAYNIQISTDNQIITHFSTHQTAGDTSTLKEHLEGYEKAYQSNTKEIIADAGYGSEENYTLLLEEQGVETYIPYNMYRKEQERAFAKKIAHPNNLFYNELGDFYICPMGQRMDRTDTCKRVSKNGYEAQVAHYQAKNCSGCPLRGICHQSKTDRIIEINHHLNAQKEQIRANLASEKGQELYKQRCIEPETVFGNLKQNKKFARFTLRGIEKVTLEFGLHALAHNIAKFIKMTGSLLDFSFVAPIRLLLSFKFALKSILRELQHSQVLKIYFH